MTLKFDGKPQNCPVTDNVVNVMVNTNEYYKPVNTRWKPEKAGEYKTNFNEQDIANLEAKLESVELNSLSQREMDGLVKDM